MGNCTKRLTAVFAVILTTGLMVQSVFAHHSFAMYDRSINYVFTGVVDSINPDPAHLQINFVPLNDARDALVRDASGERMTWAVEMEGAARSAREGISVSSFPRGTVFSVGLIPLRNGELSGVRVGSIFSCPEGEAPKAGEHCNSVPGAIHIGEEELPAATQAWAP